MLLLCETTFLSNWLSWSFSAVAELLVNINISDIFSAHSFSWTIFFPINHEQQMLSFTMSNIGQKFLLIKIITWYVVGVTQCVIYFVVMSRVSCCVVNALKIDTDVYSLCLLLQVFLVRKVKGSDSGHLYAMKVLKKATLKGRLVTACWFMCHCDKSFLCTNLCLLPFEACHVYR